MKELITSIAASDTKTILHVVDYKPEHEIIGVIQVLHGMTEHIGRYKEFAKFFTDKGYAVIGHDMIGYGKTKSYGMKETYLEHWEDAVTDIESIRKFIQEKYPDIPIYQLGIGMGAYFGMAHQIQYPERYYKRIYIGAGRKNKFLLKTSSLYFDLKRSRKKQQIPVPSDQILNIFEKYYPENGDFSWRYRSNSCWEKYMDDPLVNFQTTEGTIAEILKVMLFVYAADLRKVLTPVMFITGEEDPEEHFGKDTIRLNQDYRDAEVPVTLKIIAGYRHDILHDACAENVFDDIYRFIQAES